MLSVIIPTLNEADAITAILDDLAEQQDIELEVIVVDGGSEDETCHLVRAADVTLIRSSRGRGRQLNAGAAVAAGTHLLFLHADSRLTSDHQLINAYERLIQEQGHVAGHFPLLFQSHSLEIKSSLHFFEAKTGLNRQGTWNGDQGLMLSASLFRLTGGFNETFEYLEDQEFGQRFWMLGRFITFNESLLTSARRFEQEGFNQRVTLNTLIMGMFQLSLGEFFSDETYHSARKPDGLRLSPFLRKARQLFYRDGLTRALVRYYALGRYATKNLWQFYLWRGLRRNNPCQWLRYHDRWARPLVDNPAGYLFAAILVALWFHTTEILAIRRDK